MYGSSKMAMPVPPFAKDCAITSNISSERRRPPAKAVAPIVVRVGIICQPGPSAAFSRATWVARRRRFFCPQYQPGLLYTPAAFRARQSKMPSLLPLQHPLLSAAQPPKRAVLVLGEAVRVASIISSSQLLAIR